MKQSGAATLPVILLISGIVIELAIAGVVVSALLTNTIFSSRLSAEALAAARAGAQDAIIRIIRYKNCPGPDGCPSSYCLNGALDYPTCTANGTIAGPTTSVTMSNSGSGIITVTSIGTAVTRKKKVEAVVGVDTSSGKISILSLEEVSL